MTKVSASIGKELYKVEIVSRSGNKLIADEPIAIGGKNLGFSPKELLASSLAACTSATLRMYADHKEWNLTEVKVDIELHRDDAENITTINRNIELIGNLNEEQKLRLLAVANNCPLHKILSNPIKINTVII
jgi:putative redox protein